VPRRAGRHGAGSPVIIGDPRSDTGPGGRVSTGPSPRVSTGPNPRVSTAPHAPVSTGPHPRVTTGLNTPVSTGPHPRVTTGPNTPVSTAPNPHVSTGPHVSTAPHVSTGPNPRVSTGAETSAPSDAPRTGRTATGGRRLSSRTGRRERSVSVMLALAAAGLLVLAAVGTLVYTVLHDSSKPKLAGQSHPKPSATASASPTVGPYGDIASRQTDPQPLTLAQLFPASFTEVGNTVTSAAMSLGSDCASAIIGATLQSAAGAADCTQVARATYVESPAGFMATIGVLNLSTGDAAKTAAQSADANDFISQLTASSGPAQQIGQGTGIEEALAKGHYLILVWAELTSLQSPTAQQSTDIETFMTQLVQATVNKDLTNRMLTGAP
jgi:hypothetical protein